MKIIFCDNGLEPFLNFRGYIARHFHELGHEVWIVVPQSTCTDKIIANVPQWLTVHPLVMNRNGSNPLSDASYCIALIKLFRKENPDIVFTYTIKPNIYGSLAADKQGIPVVAMVAGLGYAFSENSLKHRLGRLLYRYGLRRANKVIVLNDSNYKILLTNKFVKEENLILFDGGEGVDLNQFAFHEDEYESVRFLMVARVLYDKGYSEYVEAARIVKKRYPDIKVDLLGPLAEDSPMGVPADIVKKDHNDGSITYLGETNDVPAFMGLNGVVVVVVSNYNEGFNRSLMEACAMGRICITSDIPGCKEIVKEGYNGYLVPPKNSVALANAMIKIIESSQEERKALAVNSNKRAKELFDVHFVFEKYDKIISDILN